MKITMPHRAKIYTTHTVTDELGNKIIEPTQTFVECKCYMQPVKSSQEEHLTQGQQREQRAVAYFPLRLSNGDPLPVNAYTQLTFNHEPTSPIWQIVGDPLIWLSPNNSVRFRKAELILIGGF